jgi:2-iminobutanoate/2-iminopropanoate deaminase
MQRMSWLVGVVAVLMLLWTAQAPPVLAQAAATPVELDEAGFGFVQVEALAPEAATAFTLDLAAGDRVTMDLQGETDALQVTEFAASYGPLVMDGVPESFNYLAWAPEDGEYTITVANSGDSAGGFVLRVVVTPAPPPTEKILTADAAGQTIPVTVGEPFQVALEVNVGDGYAWTLDALDAAVLAEAADPVTVPLGTMPGAMSQQIFTLQGVAPGVAKLAFTNARRSGVTAAATYSVTVEVLPVVDAEPVAPRRGVQTEQAPAPGGPYSQAIIAGPFIFTSGQIGLDPATGELADGVEAQTRQALANLTAVLAAGGAGPADVVKATVYLADMDDYAAVNAVYGEVFATAPPARSTVQVAALPRSARVMIDLVAVVLAEE